MPPENHHSHLAMKQALLQIIQILRTHLCLCLTENLQINYLRNLLILLSFDFLLIYNLKSSLIV